MLLVCMQRHLWAASQTTAQNPDSFWTVNILWLSNPEFLCYNKSKMGGLDDENNLDDSKRAERKFKKHMVEKRRRNRINYALDQLKMMVLEGLDKDPTKYDKMEKADILDLTVKYLHRILKENLHFGPEMLQCLPPMFGEQFAGAFSGASHLPIAAPGLLHDPCSSRSLLEEPLDLQNRTQMTSLSALTSQSSLTSRDVGSKSRPESPCIDVDSDGSEDECEGKSVSEKDEQRRESNKGFQPVKRQSMKQDSKPIVKRSAEVNQHEEQTKRLRLESSDTERSPPSLSSSFSSSSSASSSSLYPSIKLNITGQSVATSLGYHQTKSGPSIVRPVATVPRVSLGAESDFKSYPSLPYPPMPFPTMGAPLVLLPVMQSDLSFRPW